MTLSRFGACVFIAFAAVGAAPRLTDIQLKRMTAPPRPVSGSVWFVVDKTHSIPVSGFKIELRRGDKVVRTDTTDGNGAFNFPNPLAGEYKVCWKQPGWFPGCSPTAVIAGSDPQDAGLIHVQPAGHAVSGKVVLANGENASYIDPFFGLDSRPSVSVKGMKLKVPTNSGGWFVIPNVPPSARELVATVGGETGTAPVGLDVTITLQNARPTFANVKPSISPRGLVQASPGEIITINAPAMDIDHETLTYRWQAPAGTKVSASGQSLRYKAPGKPGVYPVTALVSDGHGGFSQRAFDVRVSGARGAATAPGLSCAEIVDYYPDVCGATTPIGCPSGQSQFLDLFKTPTDGESIECKKEKITPEDCGKRSANLYYAAVDPHKKRQTLSEFYAVAGFNADGTGGTRAAYMNDNDLGFGRDMHVIKKGRFVFSYVTNYLSNPKDPNTCVVQDPRNAQYAYDQTTSNVTATVVMEYSPLDWVGPDTSPTSIGGQVPFVKFFVYEPGGNLVNAAALDPYGAKFAPNLCLNCHGGATPGWDSRYTSANLSASFLPFDLETYKYPASGIDYASFKTLNNLILDTKPAPAIEELING